ncbi:glycosyltransferase family 2 protein [Aquirufa nivalisilvae]|jgi:glycosyltransferase involved in cell wall biosynthesis|uniref:glycosyltransferase family 2 protein n=1 Tax=Aquirufa nivalisilvae TaxID=2516557 RepID=UPI0022A8E14C|nr:glycosyltransferase [Aquirufa nivalisilvae]
MMEEKISYFPQQASESKPFFSILIPTWNNLAFLQNCIRSIRQHSTTSYQLVVHLNEGTDGSLEWIKEQGDIAYSHSEENVGVCYAMNAMRSLATADYLLYLNDDMYVLPNWDGILQEEVLACPDNYFFISATMIEPRAQSNCSIEQAYGYNLETFEEERLLKEWNTWEKEDWQGSTWPPNVVHKDLWDQVGGYSVEFSPGMYSDPDFSMKLWQAGVRLFKGVARSRVYHFGSISVKRVKQNKGYYQFIRTWGMSSGTFSKYYLQRGKPFTGPLKKRIIPFWVHLKNWYYRLSLQFKA